MAGGVAERALSDGAAQAGRETGLDLRITWIFVVLGLATRLVGHVNSGLWYDEIWTLVDYIRLPFSTLVTTYGSDNNHPLFSLLAWLSTHALGESAFSLRLPAILFGAASLGAMYVLSRMVTDRRQALLATALLLLSYHHVWFSQNARGYTILLCSTLLSTIYFLRGLRPEGSTRDLLLQGFWLAVGTFAHASAVFVAFGQLGAYGFWWLTQGRGADRSHQLRALLGILAGGALSLAMHAGILGDLIAYFTHDDNTTPAEGGESEWHSPWWTVKAVAESLGFGLVPGLLGMAAGLTVIAIGGLSYLRRAPVATLAFVLPITSCALILMMGRSLRPRFLFFEAGFFLLFIVRGLVVSAQGLGKLAPEHRRDATTTALFRTAAAGALGVFLLMLPRAYLLPKQDFEGAMAFAQGLQRNGGVVMTLGLSILPYRAYYDTSFVPIESAEAFTATADGADKAYAIHTIPVYLEAFEPALSERFHARAKEMKRFVGSMGDGDVIVYEIERGQMTEGEEP